MKNKIAIIGSRNYCCEDHVANFIYNLPCDVYIISGGAKGVDSWAKFYADSYNRDTIVFNAQWKKYGRGAGFIRNHKIIDAADAVVAFWDGKSKGTKHSIKLALNKNKSVVVITSSKNGKPRVRLFKV